LDNQPTTAAKIRWPWLAAAAIISFIVVWLVSASLENVKQSISENLHPASALIAVPNTLPTPKTPLLIKRPGAPKHLRPANSEARNSMQDLPPATVSVANSGLDQKPARINGTALFFDRKRYQGKQVVLTDGGVFEASNTGALINANGVIFWMSVEGIDRESLRYFQKNCSGIGGVLTKSPCKMPLLVTLTGEQKGRNPAVKNVKIIQ
jgi:hypothetical protein